jgi:hypothetical protein
VAKRAITNFIENQLVKNIRADLQNYQIGIERDFESLIFHHLRNFLEKKFPNIKISTNFSMIGVNVWKWRKDTKTKKKIWDTSKFVMPDIVLSKININQKKPISNHKIAFELKTVSPSSNSSPTFSAGNYQLDFRKLNKLKKDNLVDEAYFFVICSSLIKSEKDIILDIKNAKFEDGKKCVSHKKKYFKSLVINRYTDPRTKNVIASDKQIQEIQKKSMLIWRAYEDGEMPEKRQKIITNQNTRNNSAGAIKAHKTRKEQDRIARKLYGKDFKKLSESRKKNVKKIVKSKQR